MRAAQDLGHQHAGQEQIGAELGLAGDLVGPVVLDRIGADDFEFLVGIESAFLENGRHDQLLLISSAAAMTERITLS